MGSWGGLTLGSDVSYQDDMYTNSPIDTTDEIKLIQHADAYYLWNAMVAWTDTSQHWRVAVEGKNLNDERELVNSYDIESVATGGYNAPRSWYFSVGYTY
jgi:iron complex outermembrane receptor protein